MSEIQEIRDAMRVIARHLGELESSISASVARQNTPMLGGMENLERRRAEVREDRREQREEWELGHVQHQNSLLKQQNTLLLFTLIITAVGTIGTLIWSILQYCISYKCF